MIQNNTHVLVCGATGSIGKQLCSRLQQLSSFQTSTLTRKQNLKDESNSYHWKPKENLIAPDTLYKKTAVVNLTGANVMSSAWTNSRKKELYNSRILTTRLLFQELQKLPYKHRPKTYIAASAIGYYPSYKSMQTISNEESKPGKEFLSKLAQDWEAETLKISNLGMRVVIMRLSIVLTPTGGAYPALAKLAKFYMASPLGSGKQAVNWIHVDDVISFIIEAIQNKKWQGIYNLTSPEMIDSKKFIHTLNSSLNRKTIFPPVPGILIKVLLGQRASLVLKGNNASAQKLLTQDFNFKYPSLKQALDDLAIQ